VKAWLRATIERLKTTGEEAPGWPEVKY